MQRAPKYLTATFAIFILSGGLVLGFGQWWKAAPRNVAGPTEIALAAKDTVRLFALGDAGSGEAPQFEVAAAMEKRCLEVGVDGVLFLGDNFYMAGVGNVDDVQWEEKFNKPYGSPCLKKLPFYAILGNHDYRGSPAAQIQRSIKNPQWVMPKRFYRVDFGRLLRVVALDSNFYDACFSEKYCVFDFMRRSLAGAHDDGSSEDSRFTWQIAMAHHPLTSASTHGHAYSGGLYGFLVRPFVCGKADLYLSGHSHHMEHRRLEGCETDFLVSGGGGADLYDVDEKQPESKFVAKRHGFLELNFSAQKAGFRFIGTDNRILYEGQRYLAK